MRRRGFRVFVVIAVIVALSIATLSFKEVHIGSLDRVGEGPLGLKLGLDLQGGSHLQYEANLPDQLAVTFQEPVDEARLLELLRGLEQDDATVTKREFTISNLSFEEVERDELRRALELEVGPVVSFDTGDGTIEVTILLTPSGADEVPIESPEAEGGDTETATSPLPDEEDLRRVLEGLGYQDATIDTAEDGVFTIGGLELAERAVERLKVGLESRLGPADALDTGDDTFEITFRDMLAEEDLRPSLNETGHLQAIIEIPDQKAYNVGDLSVDTTTAEELRLALEDRLAPIELGGFAVSINEPDPENMKQVRKVIERRINALGTTEPLIQTLGDDQIIVQLPGVGGSTVDVTLQSIPSVISGISVTLNQFGRTGDTIEQTGPTTFVIRSDEPLVPEISDILKLVTESSMPGVVFEAGEEDAGEINVTFPPPPNEFVIANLLQDLGFTDFTVRQDSRELGSFTIRTEKSLTTAARNQIREALESEVARTTTFQTTGGIEEAKDLIGGTAQLVFVERECLSSLEDLLLNRALCEPVEQGGAGLFEDTVVDLTGRHLSRAFPSSNPTTNANELTMWFDGRGTSIFSDLTRRLVGDDRRQMAVFLDDQELFSATIQAHITDGRTRITGRFTREQTRTWATQLESGRLPVPLTLIREGNVDALLGADSLRKSLIGGLVGLGLVLIFMVVYYRMAGVVAATSLIIYAVILLAILKLIPVTLTLSGIAGLVLSIGMAVDANILIFERMKEEMRTGRTLTSAMEVGFRRAWVAIRDSNVSTILTCAILFLFGTRLAGGTPVVTGLAVTLLIGVSISMFTAYMVSRNMLQILALTPIGRNMSLFTPEPRRQPVGVAGGGK